MTTISTTVALLIAASCSSPSSGDRAILGNLEYEVPSSWISKDLSAAPRAMVQWTPSGGNERRESVTIARVERPALAKATGDYLARLLDDAQRNLSNGKFSSPSRFTTKNGFHGVKIEGAFTPPEHKQPYHRIHAILIDGSSILTVIYTAREADREAFETVVESLQQNRGG